MPFNFLLRILFPPRCVGCGMYLTEDGALCPICRDAITLDDVLRCGRCGARLPNGKKICHFDVPYVLGAATNYREPAVRGLIHALKFSGVRISAGVLAGLMSDYASRVKDWLPAPQDAVVVPIPLGAYRFRERGFNQAELIARAFAKHYGCPLAGALVRIKETGPQSELEDNARRKENVRGCFAVAAEYSFTGKRVILIDDVSTSGATLSEAAHTLVAAGARKIIALVAARAR